nr:protein SDA1 homolog isoform X2 [Tanacetum cinerariifolium]
MTKEEMKALIKAGKEDNVKYQSKAPVKKKRLPFKSIAVGLNVVREICLRIPLLMTKDLLQELVQYKKSHEKAVSSAAQSLILLFREAIVSQSQFNIC